MGPTMPRSCMGMPMLATRRTRRRPNSGRRVCKPVPKNSRLKASSAVSDKLEALKSLVPVRIDHGEIKADQLFQETAHYIILLRTQISVLQKLVDFYGSSTAQAHQNQNDVQ